MILTFVLYVISGQKTSVMTQRVNFVLHGQ